MVPTGASVATPGRDVYGFCGSVADRGDPVCALARCGGVNYPRVPQETARPSLGFHLGTPRGPLVVGKEHTPSLFFPLLMEVCGRLAASDSYQAAAAGFTGRISGFTSAIAASRIPASFASPFHISVVR